MGASSVSPLSWLHTHPPLLACFLLSAYSPGLHFLLTQTAWDLALASLGKRGSHSRLVAAREAGRKGHLHGASPGKQLPREGTFGNKILATLCLYVCWGRERELRNLPSPLCSSLSRESLFQQFSSRLPQTPALPQQQCRLCWDWARGWENVLSDS